MGEFSFMPAVVETAVIGPNMAVSGAIMAAGSADLAAMTSEVATAIGPLGCVPYVAPYAGAQASNVAATMMVSGVHAGISVTSELSKVGTLATDALLT